MGNRILHIIDHMGYGGAQRKAKEILEFDQNPEVYLAVLRKTGYMHEVRSENLLICQSTSQYSLRPLFVLLGFIRRKKINIIHCHLFKSQVFGLLLKRFLAPSLTMIHHERGSIFGSDSNTGLDLVGYDLYMRFSKPLINHYIAVSEAVNQQLEKRFSINPTKITTLPDFVDLNTFSLLYRKRIRKDLPIRLIKTFSGEFVVGIAGRLTRDKGIFLILKAALKLQNDHGLHFLIAGDGPSKLKLVSTIERNQLSNVTYAGYCDHMEDFYSTIDLLIMPSYREALGNSQYEAMAMGVPVLVSDLPSLLESVPFNPEACSFQVGNVDAMISKIQRLRNNQSDYMRISEQGTTFVKKSSPAIFFNKIHHLEKKLVENHI